MAILTTLLMGAVVKAIIDQVEPNQNDGALSLKEDDSEENKDGAGAADAIDDGVSVFSSGVGGLIDDLF